MEKTYTESEVFGGGYGMFDVEIMAVGMKVAMADGFYGDSEGYEIEVKGGVVISGGGYGWVLK